jgi:trigger factor
MTITKKEQLNENEYLLSVEVSGEQFTAAIDRAFKKNAKSIQVPGFRKGKAPRSIIEKLYGEGVFFEDAINEIYPAAYAEMVEESGLEPVNKPDVEVKSVDKNGFTFDAKITVKPAVKISAYKGLKAEKDVKTVTAKDVNAEIDMLRERNSRMVAVEDRATKNGDTVTFDFDGYVDGKQFDGGKAEKYTLVLGSGQFIPGFEEQMENKNIGDEFDVNVEFPKEYHAKELSGKPAVFKVKIHEIKVKELPELDDEFAKDVSEFDTLDELKKDTKKKIQERNKNAAENAFESAVLDKLMENTEVNIPACMIDARVDEMLNEFDYRLSSQGMSLKNYMEYTGLTEDAMRDNYKEQAEKQVKLRLSLEAVAEAEGFTASDDDVEAEIAKIAETYSVPVEQVKGLIDPKEIKKDILVNKALDVVKNSAEVLEKKAPAKKTTKKDAE